MPSRASAVAQPDRWSSSPRTTARAWASTTTTSTTARTSSIPRCAFPLIVAGPGGTAGQRSAVFAIHPRPRAHDPGRGQGLLSARPGGGEPAGRRCRGQRPARPRAALRPERPQPHRDLRPRATRSWRRPEGRDDALRPLRPRRAIRGRRENVAPREAGGPAACTRRELELFLERADREWAQTRPLARGQAGEEKLSAEACEQLRALGYVASGCPSEAPGNAEEADGRSFAGAGVGAGHALHEGRSPRRGGAAPPGASARSRAASTCSCPAARPARAPP